MNTLPFKNSRNISIGMELELQLINPTNFDLATQAKELIRLISESKHKDSIKPEITQSMIEINSQPRLYAQDFFDDLATICRFITHEARILNTFISGGGTHPFQFWGSRKIFPSQRFKQKSKEHGYLSKHHTVFAMHVHIGCLNETDALYLTHLLSRYVPQLIALSASSPFYQGIATGFQSTRSTIFGAAVPFTGMMPHFTTWKEFSDYFNKMQSLDLIESMKDIYWDIRPKPEFGTVEIRVCDMPLTLNKAIAIAAYIQTLAHYLLLEKPYPVQHELQLFYQYNRFQAARYGFDGDFINPYTMNKISISEDILETLNIIKPHAQGLKNNDLLSQIEEWVKSAQNDAQILLDIYSQNGTLEKVVEEQSKIWFEKM